MYFKKNPLDPLGYHKSKKQKQKEEAFINLKEAYLNEDLNLNEYLFVVASQIEPTEYLNERICGEALGGQLQVIQIDDIGSFVSTNTAQLPRDEMSNENIVSQNNFIREILEGANSKMFSVYTQLLSVQLEAATAVFPVVQPMEDSIANDICYECSDQLGNKGLICFQCKRPYHVKCHVAPRYANISTYY